MTAVGDIQWRSDPSYSPRLIERHASAQCHNGKLCSFDRAPHCASRTNWLVPLQPFECQSALAVTAINAPCDWPRMDRDLCWHPAHTFILRLVLRFTSLEGYISALGRVPLFVLVAFVLLSSSWPSSRI